MTPLDFQRIASGVSAPLAIGGNILSTLMANYSNTRLAERANQWSLEQWNRENEYNTPKEQMKRLVEAGLNPNLVFAQGNLMNEAAQSPAVTSAAGTQRAYTVDPLTAAQIANINADTAKKQQETQQSKEETEGVSISNRISQLEEKLKGMNFDAFKNAYDEGLVQDAVDAGFGSAVTDYRLGRMQLFESAWNLAIYTGVNAQDHLLASYNRNKWSVDPEFSFSKSAWNRASKLFISGQEAQTEANHAAKLVASLQQQQKKKDFDIYKALNNSAQFGKTSFERTAAKVALLALFIAEQRLSLPSFNLSIRGADKSSHFSYTSAPRGDTKIFNNR